MLGQVRHQRVALQDAGRRAPTRRRARRSSPGRAGRAVPWGATRRAAAMGCRRSAPRTGRRCGGARSAFHTGGVRSGAGHSMSRSSAGHDAAQRGLGDGVGRVAFLLANLAVAGGEPATWPRRRRSRACAGHPRCSSRSRRRGVRGACRSPAATSKRRSSPAGSRRACAFSSQRARVVSVGPGYRVSGRAVIARVYPAATSPNDNIRAKLSTNRTSGHECDPGHTRWPARRG